MLDGVPHIQEKEGQSKKRKTVCTFMLQSFYKLLFSALGEKTKETKCKGHWVHHCFSY